MIARAKKRAIARMNRLRINGRVPKLVVKCEVKPSVMDKADDVVGNAVAGDGMEPIAVTETSSTIERVHAGNSRKRPAKRSTQAALKRALRVMKK